MNLKDIAILVGAVVLSVLVVGVFFSPEDGRPGRDGNNGQDGVGAVPGPDVYNPMMFRAGAVIGGRVVSTSTAQSSATLLNTDLINTISGEITTRLEVTPTQAALTLTLPASSTLTNFAPNDGDTVTILVENEATAATTTTIAAGAGMDLQEPDGQNVVIGQNNFAWLTFQRDENGDFIVRVDETIPAD